MASIISAGTTSATALNMSADTSGVLQLASNNGTVGLTVTTAQRIGIGTTTPTELVQIRSASSDPYLLIGGDARDCGIKFNATTEFTALRADGANRLFINAGSEMRFLIANTESARLNSSGNMLVGTSTDYGGRLQAVTDSSRLISNGNGIYRVFTHRTAKASNTTSTCAITFGSQGNQHASHVVEILFAAAQDDANGGVGGRATFLCGSLTGVGTVSEIQDIGTGVSFTASASGSVLTITATTTSNRNVVAWTAKITSTFVDAAPTSMSIA